MDQTQLKFGVDDGVRGAERLDLFQVFLAFIAFLIEIPAHRKVGEQFLGEKSRAYV